ncbi:MAG: hypothetical protein ACJ8CR_31965 [Roseiflexaceae bacterium]
MTAADRTLRRARRGVPNVTAATSLPRLARFGLAWGRCVIRWLDQAREFGL